MPLLMGAKIALEPKKSHRYRACYTILQGSEAIGEIELDQIAWRSGEAELKISIPESRVQNRGYGTDAVKTLLQHAFTKMNLRRIYLRVYATNLAALRCYEKAGFKKEWRLHRLSRENKEKTIFLMGITREAFLKNADPNKKVV